MAADAGGAEPEHQITVVIPAWGTTYRGALPAALASAAGPDRRVLVVVPAREPEPRVTPGVEVLRAQGPLSVGGARNLGLTAVRSPFVVFLDADDELVPGALEVMAAELARDPDAAAAVTAVVDRESGEVVAPRRGVASLARSPRTLALADAVWSLLPTQGCALIRTGAALDSGGYADADGGEDWAFGVALACRGRIVVLPEPGLVYSPAAGAGGGNAPVSREEMRARAQLARASWRRSTGFAGSLALPFIALAQLAIIDVLRPLLGRRGTE